MSGRFAAILTITSMVGGALSVIASLYMTGLTLVGFADYSLMPTKIVWIIISLGLAINSILFLRRKEIFIGNINILFVIISLIISIIIITPIIYVALDLGSGASI